MTLLKILKNFLICLNQTANTLIRLNGEYGTPDEMFSARAWRLRASHPRLHVWINRLFFFDQDHCRAAYEAEQQRRDFPKEYRQ